MEAKGNERTAKFLAVLVLAVLVLCGGMVGWVIRGQQGNESQTTDDDEATTNRCLQDCEADEHRKSLFKPGTEMRQTECWCKSRDGTFYEMMW